MSEPHSLPFPSSPSPRPRKGSKTRVACEEINEHLEFDTPWALRIAKSTYYKGGVGTSEWGP